MTDFSRLSRFGMTFKPLTADRGEELLTSYLAVFHAKTSPQPEKVQELTESDQECGERWQGSFTKYDRDSCLWKTHQCLLLGDLEPFLETWPRWGLMRDGECWEQPMSAHRINVIEFGLEPDNDKFFHTPNTTGMDGGSNSRKALKKRTLPTPTASMMPCEGTVRMMRKQWLDGEFTLAEASAIAGRDVRKAQGKVAMWPTPVKSDSQARRPSKGWKGDSDLPSVVWQVDGGIENPEKPPAQLNADWVEWLMGWPLGWTDLKPLEMDKYHSWLQQHGKI
jgi:DNA (cytosine-5)-methyltransferase 1